MKSFHAHPIERDFHETVYRYRDCELYRNCVESSEKKNWSNFTCEGCWNFLMTKAAWSQFGSRKYIWKQRKLTSSKLKDLWYSFAVWINEWLPR